MMMFHLSPVLMRYWLVKPGWSTSCTAQARMAAMISSEVKHWARALLERRRWVDWVTSAAWRWLW